MPDSLPPCPECSSVYTYEMGALLVCPECAHEWTPEAGGGDEGYAGEDAVVKDSVGNVLANGDTVAVIKDLKVKGYAASIKMGTKVPQRMFDLFAGLDEDVDTRKLLAATQIAELVRTLEREGVKNFHFYTLNRADLTYAICHLLGLRPAASS